MASAAFPSPRDQTIITIDPGRHAPSMACLQELRYRLLPMVLVVLVMFVMFVVFGDARSMLDDCAL